MNHFSAEEWINYVTGAKGRTARQQMQKHLDAGCKQCSETVALWRKVQRSGADERRFGPPAETVRMIKAAFSGAGYQPKPGLAGVIAELVFDSFHGKVLAGARSAGMQTRQMLFSSTPFQIDLSIEAKPGETRLLVTGQLMDTSQPDSVGRGVPVTLSNRRGQTIQTVTNKFGEFHGEIENRGDLELSFPGKGEKPVVVSLRDALAYMPDASRGSSDPKKFAD